MQQVQEALTTAGYHVSNSSGGPVMDVDVAHYRFNNYTWFIPLVPTWGSIKLKASLVTANGNTVWRQDFAATGWTMNFTDGYTIAAANCTTEIMQQMVTEFGSERFATALKQQ